MCLSMLIIISLVACGNEKQWTKDEILEMFKNKSEPGWSVVECFVTDDLGFDFVGAVLFTDNDETCVAFINADGQYTMCSTNTKLADSPDANYCGDGTVSYMAEADDGVVYEQRVTFEKTWNSSGFDIDDNYYEALAAKQEQDRKAD